MNKRNILAAASSLCVIFSIIGFVKYYNKKKTEKELELEDEYLFNE